MGENLPAYECCTLCPRQCKANRANGQYGVCGEDSQLRISVLTPHFGEEPPLTGTYGSGTIFFTGCSCCCFFCQNYQISRGSRAQRPGKIYTQEGFLVALKALIAQGVHNLNFVTPDHFWPHIQQSCQELRNQGFTLPFFWNSSGYEELQVIRQAVKIIDGFLPDFKFANRDLAEMCMGDRNYPLYALQAIEAMIEARGFLRPWDDTGAITASCGVMVRHLVLPGQLKNSLTALKMLHTAFGSQLPISLMSQFMPMPECQKRGFLNQRLTQEEFNRVKDYAEELGFTRIFYQEGLGDDRFAPDFTRENPFPRPEKASEKA